MNSSYPFGSLEWIRMVGEEMSLAITRKQPPSEYKISFIECYHGGPPLLEGFLPGFRLDIEGVRLTFRPGAGVDEHADVRLDADIGAVEALSKIYLADPAFNRTMEEFISKGKVRIIGDLTSLSPWIDGVHDAVTARTL